MEEEGNNANSKRHIKQMIRFKKEKQKVDESELKGDQKFSSSNVLPK